MMRPSKTRTLIAHLLLWGVILGLASTVIGLLILETSSDFSTWSAWIDTNKVALLAWRLVLYSVTAGGWYRMRISLAIRGLTAKQNHRLLCAELSAIGVLVLLEWSIFATASRSRSHP
jgi:hypothetical protein